MNGRNPMRLMLSRETLRNLQDTDLAAVAGGRRGRQRERRARTEPYVVTGGTCPHVPDLIGSAMNARIHEEMGP